MNHRAGFGIDDTTIFRLGRSLLPALAVPTERPAHSIDHVTMAVGIHVAQTYGGMPPVSRIAAGRLAPWQERRAKEIISANLGGVPLADVARERPPVEIISIARSIALFKWRRTNGYCRVASRLPRRRAARWPIIAIGCGLGVRLQRSEPPHANFQPIGWHKSGRMAPGASTKSRDHNHRSVKRG